MTPYGKSDTYLQKDSPNLAETKFWLGEGVLAPAAAGQPTPAPAQGGTQVRVATATGPSTHARARRSPTGKKGSAKEDYAGKENACEVKASAGEKGGREEAYSRGEARPGEKALSRAEVVIRCGGFWTTSWE
jgi:hypothetical protein